MVLMNLAQLAENYDCLTEQVSRLVDTLPREEQIDVLIALQEKLHDRCRTMQAAILACWLDAYCAEEVSHA